MLNNDYNKQYDRRQKIKKTTLVRGIDIGAGFNAVGFMNKDGNYNSREGFDEFVRITESIQAISDTTCLTIPQVGRLLLCYWYLLNRIVRRLQRNRRITNCVTD